MENLEILVMRPTQGTAVVVGYSHNFGGGLNFSGEYRNFEKCKACIR